MSHNPSCDLGDLNASGVLPQRLTEVGPPKAGLDARLRAGDIVISLRGNANFCAVVTPDLADRETYQAAVRALLDKHIDATDMIAIVPPVDIFDEASFKAMVEEQTGSAASVADAITSAATRTITERMEEDPAMYRRFSRMVQDIIDDFRAGRLSEADYLHRAKTARDEIVAGAAGAGDDVPASVRGDPLRRALYGQAAENLADISGAQAVEVAELIANAFSDIVVRHRRVGWTTDPDIEKAMHQDMDDYLFDEIRGRRGQYGLDTDRIDQMLDAAIRIAKKQAAQ